MKEDIKKIHKDLYDVSNGRIDVVDVPEFNYLMINGVGNPRTDEFKAKIQLLKKFCKEVKKYYADMGKEKEFLSAPIEGLWNTYGEQNIDIVRSSDIRYRLLVVFPDKFTNKDLAKCVERYKNNIIEKSKREKIEIRHQRQFELLDQLYLEKFTEGKCVQTLHVGPYDEEIVSTTQIMEYITISGMKLHGEHHEIYLNDFLKVSPERLKTIVRYSIV